MITLQKYFFILKDTHKITDLNIKITMHIKHNNTPMTEKKFEISAADKRV